MSATAVILHEHHPLAHFKGHGAVHGEAPLGVVAIHLGLEVTVLTSQRLHMVCIDGIGLTIVGGQVDCLIA